MYTIEVLPGADLDVIEHCAFLDTREIGLGTRLVNEIEDVFAYRIMGESIVQVVAVRHVRQHPTAWKRRI